MSYSPIIEAPALLDLLHSDQLVIIDASNGPQAKANYLQSHIKGALFVDLNTQLSSPSADPAKGGRHPLPELEKFANMLGELGITSATHVVIYDDKNGSNAGARLWWMLRAVGHPKVQVLNGGFATAKQCRLPMQSDVEHPKPGNPYPAEKWALPLASLEEVRRASQYDSSIIVDVRSADRYHGLVEPLDVVAGHIPNAINIPFTSNLDEQGCFKDAEVLREMYLSFGEERVNQPIVHCGSGVTACHTILAFDYAGLRLPKLYIGSWSEWSSNESSSSSY